MKRRFYLWFALFLFLVGLALFASLIRPQRALAQAPAPTQAPGKLVSDNDVNRVAKKLYCPVCPNTPLDVCETKACKDWRAQIREQIASGWTDQQVMDYFVQRYGERVLAEPERGGFTSLVWVLPVLVAGLGLVLVALVLRSWRASRKVQPASGQPTHPETPAVPRDVLAKIEAEIRQMD